MTRRSRYEIISIAHLNRRESITPEETMPRFEIISIALSAEHHSSGGVDDVQFEIISI
jgi:hypothetical protein